MAKVKLKVHPRAKVNRVSGRLGDAYKLHLSAPAVDGKANEACIRFFSDLMHVSQSQIRIVSGLTSRIKVVEIVGVTQDEVEAQLQR
jgi:uncharacterized protein (TIGR00251 family)